MSRYWMRQVPNALTLLRMALIPWFTTLFLQKNYTMALILFTLAGVTDYFDGALARRLGYKTQLGAVLDPAADKLLMLVSFLALSWAGFIPPWLSALVIGRDLYIILGYGYLRYHYGNFPIRVTRLSKRNTFFQLLLIFSVFVEAFLRQKLPAFFSSYENFFGVFQHGLFYLLTLLTFLTGLQYTRIAGEIRKQVKDHGAAPVSKTF